MPSSTSTPSTPSQLVSPLVSQFLLIECQVWFEIHLLRYKLYHKIIFRTIILYFTLPITFLADQLHFSKEMYWGWLTRNYFTSFLVTLKIVAICIGFCSLVVLYTKNTKNSIMSSILASLGSKTSQNPLKQPPTVEKRHIGTIFLEILLKLKNLWPQDIIMNYVTKNNEDLGIF